MTLMPMILAASNDRVFDSLRSGFQQPKLSMLAVMLAVPFLILIATMLWLYMTKGRQWTQEELNSTDDLFIELATAHGLSAEERAELQNLAKEWKIESTVALFVRPDLFTRNEESFADYPSERRHRVHQLRSRLFGRDPIAPTSAPGDGGEKMDFALRGDVAVQTPTG